jgi:hypothetical protein
MTDTPPSPKRRRCRWLVVGALLLSLVGAISWWNWSRPDTRFVGTWRVGTDVTWKLTLDGRLLQIADGRPVYILDWAVSGDTFQMLPKREHWLSSAMASIMRLTQGKKPTLSQRWRIVDVSANQIVLDPRGKRRQDVTLMLTRLRE